MDPIKAISSLFSSPAPQQQQPQAQQQQPNMAANGNPANMQVQNPVAAVTPGTDANGQVPAIKQPDPNNTAAANTAASPLDHFAGLWDTPTDSNRVDPNAPLLNIDPAKVLEAARKTDFSQLVTPEQRAAIAAGGEGAVAAFLSAMNTVGQGAYGQSALATTKIVEAAVAKAMKNVPELIRNQNANESIRGKNPLFDNPAVKPIMSALSAQLQIKYPNATTAELANMAGQYVEALGTSFAPKSAEPKTANGRKAPVEQDWSGFFE